MRQLPNNILEKTLNYLASRPYAEVATLINELANLPKLESGQARIPGGEAMLKNKTNKNKTLKK